ncbi:MAG: ATP-binding protein, partial [Thermoleophilia bacterium]|nr:ATP-binding protein [Thermoleophilia bacterium]
MTWPLIGRATELAHVQEILASSSGRGVMLYGSAGVGKSRLARHFAEGWTEQGGVVVAAIASRATSGMVLGAFAQHLPPAGDVLDPVALLLAARRALVSTEADTLIYVDDAHLLDDTSAVLVMQLAREPTVRVLLT